MIRLLVQGDDFGSTRSATEAIMEAHEFGLLRNASVMVASEYAEEAGRYARTSTLCFGLHVTLNSEWGGCEWRPVRPKEHIQTLVNERGIFYPSPRELIDRKPSLGEIELEVKAQLDLAREYGFKITYLDTHMRFEWIDSNLTDMLVRLCRSEGLIYYKPYEKYVPMEPAIADPTDRLLEAIPKLDGGPYLWLTHPDYLGKETVAIMGESVAAERDTERRMLLDGRIREAMTQHNINSVRYDDIN